MDQASRIIARWTGVSDVIGEERIACAAWKRAVGKRVALRTRALKLVRTTLVVEVEDELWRKNLWSLRYQILAQSRKGDRAGDCHRRGTARDAAASGAAARTGSRARRWNRSTKRKSIADPGLRRIYKAARQPRNRLTTRPNTYENRILKLTEAEVDTSRISPISTSPTPEIDRHGCTIWAAFSSIWTSWPESIPRVSSRCRRCFTRPKKPRLCGPMWSARRSMNAVALANAPASGNGYFKVPK